VTAPYRLPARSAPASLVGEKFAVTPTIQDPAAVPTVPAMTVSRPFNSGGRVVPSRQVMQNVAAGGGRGRLGRAGSTGALTSALPAGGRRGWARCPAALATSSWVGASPGELRLGHYKTIGAIAHRICQLIWIILHKGVRYEERGPAVSEKSKRPRTARMIRTLRTLGYRVEPLGNPV